MSRRPAGEKRGRVARYSLFQYGPYHFAIDCEECDRKVCNLKRESTAGEIIDRLRQHDKQHPDPPRQYPPKVGAKLALRTIDGGAEGD